MNAEETDWAAIHKQIDAVNSALERERTASPERQKEILAARAHELARPVVTAPDAAGQIQIVEFDLANERYGFDLEQVREVFLLRDITPVPCTPAFVAGIINLRGEILTVIDLKTFFDLPEKGISELNKIILVHGEQMLLGILADRIRGVRAVPLASLQPSLPTLTGIRSEYLRGITSERVILLDAAKILSDRNLIVYEEVTG